MTAKIQVLPEFDPPGWPYVDDHLSADQKEYWSSQQVSAWMNSEITAKNEDGTPLTGGGGVLRTPLTQFFNGTVTPYNTAQTGATITWIGFPGLITKRDPNNRWKIVEGNRDVMDEYLEWTTSVDSDDRIQYINYTCEGFEYFSFLGSQAPEILLQLYKSANPDFASQIQMEDLLDSTGQYEPYNKWNGVLCDTPGHPELGLTTVNPGSIMHLAQVNNTLGAEIDIAAQATVLRKDSTGKLVNDATQLCDCSKYGDSNRNSDPSIGIGINQHAQKGELISIANPVAIYITDFNTANFGLDVDGTGQNLQPIPEGTFSWVRGNIDKNMGLRLRIQIPPGTTGTGSNDGRQLTVSDIFDSATNKYIEYGGQFADYLTMGVRAVTITGGRPAPAQFCPKVPPKKGAPHHRIAEAAGAVAEDAVEVPAGPRRTAKGLHTVRRPEATC